MRGDETPQASALQLAVQQQPPGNKWATVRSNLGRTTLNAAEARSGSSSPKKSGGMLKSMADVVIAAQKEKDKKLASHEAQDQNAEQVASSSLLAHPQSKKKNPYSFPTPSSFFFFTPSSFALYTSLLSRFRV